MLHVFMYVWTGNIPMLEKNVRGCIAVTSSNTMTENITTMEHHYGI